MACPNSISSTHYVYATCGLRYINCVSIKAQTEEEMRGEDEGRRGEQGVQEESNGNGLQKIWCGVMVLHRS